MMEQYRHKVQSMFAEISEIPQIKRGKVWCKTCGRMEDVSGRNCLRNGWPKCCGYTMTIDSPEERKVDSE